MSARPRVLVSAYSCDPVRSSEAAVAWNLCIEVSRWCDVWTVTRGANRLAIEADPRASRVRWIYHDLPSPFLALKRRTGTVYPYYLAWQVAARSRLRAAASEEPADLVHHLTFGTALLPSLAAVPGLPCIWGPIGGLSAAPMAHLARLPWRGKRSEVLRALLVAAVRRGGMRAWGTRPDCILTVSEVTCRALPSTLRQRARVFSQVGLDEAALAAGRGPAPQEGSDFTVLMAGRLLAWKGFGLGLQAFASWRTRPDTARLCVIGGGPDEIWLRRLASQLGVGDRVEFLAAMPKAAYLSHVRRCSVLLFPSLHEPGAFVIAEAMAAGKPVICSDFGEPATLVSDATGIRVPWGRPDEMVRSIAVAMDALCRDGELRKAMGAAARVRAAGFSWMERARELAEVYQDVLSQGAGVRVATGTGVDR